eukprot:m.289693 g.289693  ORF g.289693 m.289693 type:complete len:370 (-) comp19461_c1_seq12:315-1424(-)
MQLRSVALSCPPLRQYCSPQPPTMGCHPFVLALLVSHLLLGGMSAREQPLPLPRTTAKATHAAAAAARGTSVDLCALHCGGSVPGVPQTQEFRPSSSQPPPQPSRPGGQHVENTNTDVHCVDKCNTDNSGRGCELSTAVPNALPTALPQPPPELRGQLVKNCISQADVHLLRAAADSLLTEDTDSGFSASVYLQRPDQGSWKVRNIVASLTTRFGFPLQHAEPLALTRYTKGQQYGMHFDSGYALNGTTVQRTATLIVYLETLSWEAGGATVFPAPCNCLADPNWTVPSKRPSLKDACGLESAALRVQPEAGQCLLFYNHVDATRQTLPLTRASLHGACPVAASVKKYIAQLWLHDREHQRSGFWFGPS